MNSKNNKHRTKSPIIAWMRRHSIGLLAGVMASLAVVSVVFCMGIQGYGGETVWVYFPRSCTFSCVCDSLRSNLGTIEGNRVYLLWRIFGGDVERVRGAYRVAHGQRSITTAWRMKRGAQTPVRVSWSDVRTIEQLADRVTAYLECSADEFIAGCGVVLPDSGFCKDEFPAAFIPDTYEMYWTVSGENVVRRLLEYRNRFWNVERIGKAAELGLTPVQVSTLASIVEEESSKNDERPTIARLYLNRIDRGMPLQADPTVKYAVGDFSLRRIRSEHLKCESPFNTYIHKGLPPGPIRVASKSAIESVLNAPSHNYIYMCAKEDFSGYHNFSSDYATHLSNARRYQRELNRRNIH